MTGTMCPRDTYVWPGTMWAVERLDDGTHLAMCGRCDWQRTVKSMSGGKRSAAHHYGTCHRDMEGEAA
jgi:hypothetical protein